MLAAVVVVIILAALVALAAVALWRAHQWARNNQAEHVALLGQEKGLDAALVQATAATQAGTTAKDALVAAVSTAVAALNASLAQLQTNGKMADEAHASFARLSMGLDPGLVRDASKLQSDQTQLKAVLDSLGAAMASMTGPGSQLATAQAALQQLQAEFDAADASLAAAYPASLVDKVADLLQLEVRVRDMVQTLSTFMDSSYVSIMAIDDLLGESATKADLDQAAAKLRQAYAQIDASLTTMFGQDVRAGGSAFVTQANQLSQTLNDTLSSLATRQTALTQLRLADTQKTTLDATTLCLGSGGACFSKADLQLLAAK